MIIIIAYDVSADHRREKVVQALKAVGERIQYSVFECEITPEKLLSLQDQLARVINPRKDRVHFYPICQACFGRASSMGCPYRGNTLDL